MDEGPKSAISQGQGELHDREQRAGVGPRRMSTSAGGHRRPHTGMWAEVGQAADSHGDSRQSKTRVKAQGCAHPICVMLKEISTDTFKYPFCLVHSNIGVRMTPKIMRMHHYYSNFASLIIQPSLTAMSQQSPNLKSPRETSSLPWQPHCSLTASAGLRH